MLGSVLSCWQEMKKFHQNELSAFEFAAFVKHRRMRRSLVSCSWQVNHCGRDDLQKMTALFLRMFSSWIFKCHWSQIPMKQPSDILMRNKQQIFICWGFFWGVLSIRMFVPCAPSTSTYSPLFSGRCGRFSALLNVEKERKETCMPYMLKDVCFDSCAVQQKYTWETLTELQLAESKASFLFLSLFLQNSNNCGCFKGLRAELLKFLLDWMEIWQC